LGALGRTIGAPKVSHEPSGTDLIDILQHPDINFDRTTSKERRSKQRIEYGASSFVEVEREVEVELRGNVYYAALVCPLQAVQKQI